MMIDANMPDELLEHEWEAIDWNVYTDRVEALQRNLAIAAKKGKNKAVTAIQWRIIESVEARVLAVRAVCGKMPKPGVDGVVWRTSAEKMRAACLLTPIGYRAKSLYLQKFTPKNQLKERHIKISTYHDRAMQVLYKFALDPVSEATADTKSFAFRKHRSTFDAHSYLMRAFSRSNPPRYALKTDIKACYATISHQWLLNNIPINKYFLREMLKAGHFFKGEFFPVDDIGISLGSPISPIIANMTLDGLQDAIYTGLHGRAYDIDFADGELIRYADDILIITRTRDGAERAKEILIAFLAVRGLVPSEEKTSIVDINVGLDFLSRYYYRVDGIVLSMPSEEAIAKLKNELYEMILPYRGGQKKLIKAINYKLVGWANNHKITSAEPAFRNIDAFVTSVLFNHCKIIHRRMKETTIKKKFFSRNADGTYTYFLVGNPQTRVKHISQTIMITHKPIAIQNNPYIDTDYFEARSNERAIRNVSGKYKEIWERQEGKCYYCGNPILVDEERCVVYVDLELPSNKEISAYVHDSCSRGTFELCETDYNLMENQSATDLLLKRLQCGVGTFVKGRQTHSKYAPLHKYFQTCDKNYLSLKFDDIEKIIGQPLCRSARTDKYYWAFPYRNTFSLSWKSNGYALKSVDIAKGTVTFEKKTSNIDGVSAEIPYEILYEPIPYGAKVKLRLSIEAIRKEYNF